MTKRTSKPPVPIVCPICEENPATVRVTAVDANGTVLDSTVTCARCLNHYGTHSLSVGVPGPTTPLTE